MTTASISPGNQAGFAQHPPVVGAARFTDGQVEGSAQSLFIRPCSEFSDDSTTALFGLRHPAFYMLMYGAARPGCRPPATDEAYALLVSVLDRAAGAGRLRVPVDVATRVVHAATTGAT